VAPLSDDVLREMIRSTPAAGWRSFIDHYTPLILGLIRRAGVHDGDEVMEVYVLLCEQLSARGFERLRTQSAARGSLGGWLTVVVRHTIVDWVRSRKGRRRLFQSVQALPALERRVFELYYWDERSPSEIAETIAAETGGEPDLARVFGALEAIHAVLTERHRADLCAMAARSKAPAPIDDLDVADRTPDAAPDAEASLRVRELNDALEHALARLPAEDAAIVRLKYVEGLSTPDVERALGIRGLTRVRVDGILASLRQALAHT
jgi:DNA-directed RNA polymerase specialized sigma24 family protein